MQERRSKRSEAMGIAAAIFRFVRYEMTA